MPHGGLRAIGAEQAIPPGQVEAEIAVGFPSVYRMMDAMHVGRDDDEAKHAIKPERQRTLPWLNIDVAFSSTSNTSTASGGAPSATTAASLISIERRISPDGSAAPSSRRIPDPRDARDAAATTQGTA